MSGKQAGGTRHLELARYLVRWGHRFTVIAGTVSYLTSQVLAHCQGRLFTREDTEGITVWRAFTYSKLHRSFFNRVLSFLSFMLSSFVAGLRVRDIDIVLGTSPPIFQGISAYLLSRLRRVPFVFEVRDLWPDFAIEMGVLRNPLLIRMSRWLEVFLYRRADLIIVNSPGFIPHLRRYAVPAEKIALVPNSVEVEMFNPADRGEEVRRELNLDDKFIALYAGAHGPANDLYTLLLSAKLLEEYDDIVFVLVGDGKERPKLMRQAEKLRLRNVRFVPAQPKARMPAFLAAADVCVAILKNIPMFTTTYPNKVFDYMAAGRPTLLAIDGVIRQVIEDADGGIFAQPGDSEALVNGLLTLYKKPCLRSQQGMNARSYVATYFDRSEQALKLETAIYSMCKERHAQRKKSNNNRRC